MYLFKFNCYNFKKNVFCDLKIMNQTNVAKFEIHSHSKINIT